MQIHDTLKKRATLAFILYMLLLFWILILKCNLRLGVLESRYILGAMTLAKRTILSLGSFATTYPREAILNIIVFIPIGLMTPFITKKNPYIVSALVGVAISLIAEVSQLLLAIGGFTYVDIINNSLGAFMGAIIHFHFAHRVKESVLISIINSASVIHTIAIIYATINTIKNIEIYLLPAKDLL